MGIIYLDNNATTFINTKVKNFMQQYLEDNTAHNPSSLHKFGRDAKFSLEQSKRRILNAVLGNSASQYGVILTSSGTEANNQIINTFGSRVIIGPTEHESILRPALLANAKALQCNHAGNAYLEEIMPLAEQIAGMAEKGDSKATTISNLGQGRLREKNQNAKGKTGWQVGVKDGDTLISIAQSNSETGVIQNITEAIRRAKDANLYLHSDFVQSFGKVVQPTSGGGKTTERSSKSTTKGENQEVSLGKAIDGINQHCSYNIHSTTLLPDYITLSGHKIGGPVGIGCLIYRKTSPIPKPIMLGGGQEGGLRSGTQSVMLATAFAIAIEEAMNNLECNIAQWGKMQNQLENGIEKMGGTIIAKDSPRLTNTSMVYMPNVSAEAQLALFDMCGIMVSKGSACSSGKAQKSSTLRAMEIPDEIANNSIRISLGQHNTMEEIKFFCEQWERINSSKF